MNFPWNHLARTATFLTIAFTISSCGKSKQKDSDQPGVENKTASEEITKSSKPVLPGPVKKISEADMKSATAFAHRAEAAVKSKDKEFLKNLFDFPTIMERSIAGIDAPDDFMKGVKIGMKSANEQAANALMASKFDLIEMRQVNGNPAALFRIRPDGALDYLEYQFERVEGSADDWVITEAYTFSAGTYISDLVRSMVVPMLAQVNQNLVQRLMNSGTKGSMLQNMPKLQQMKALTQAGKAPEAIKLWKTIPQSVKKEKFAMLMYIQATSGLEGMELPDSEYLKALKIYEKTFPGDPSLALHSIDLYLLQGNYEKTYEVLDGLRKTVNDPYIDFYKSYVKLIEKKYDESEKLARDWIVLEPEDSEGWDILFETGFASENHKLTAQALTVLEAEFNQDFGGVLIAEQFKSFRDSPEGKAWAAARQ